MEPSITDEEIRTFISSQRKSKGENILANNIRKHFGDRVLDNNGQISEIFWHKLFEISAADVRTHKKRYQRLLFRIVAITTLLLAGICLALYLWITR